MQLLPELAEKIIQEVSLVINEDLIVVDRTGLIIASTKVDRVGDFHEIAHRVVQTRQKYYITEAEALKVSRVKAGINLPIFFENRVIGVLGITGPPSQIEGFAELLRKMTELMIRETYYTEQKESESRGLEAYFYEWVFSKEVDQTFIHRGQLLGVSIGKPYLCILFQVRSIKEKQRVDAAMMDWFKNLFPKNANDMFIRWGEGRYLLLKHVREDEPKQDIREHLYRWKRYFKTNYEINLCAGMSKSTITYDLHRAYEEAEKALKVALSKQHIVMYEELVLDIVLEEISGDTKEEFTNRVLSGIQDKPELLHTLKVFLLQNQSVKDTANAMNIHINTLHYRLKQIKDLTTLDPRNSEGITLFYIALSFIGEDLHHSRSQ
ncbi:CdaR family transcriptional regulator [Halobacillus mangrovi]|uniref:CdaR family transcriptional regulator n=1 Tax=Halobacillus mangrovi TaxID=402384 RepID=UPI003D96992D